MTAYYNEWDPAAAAVLRQQVADGVIAPGDVDTRSIKEVSADDLKGYTQCHFFAGGGLWSVAARAAGWPDERPIWSASCPCQPFSGAGKRAGFDDPRHLWPDLFRIIRGARARGYGPPVLVGEQVSQAAGYDWFDRVRADLATEGIASRVRDFPACAVDAPHQRNRLYWIAVALADGGREARRGVFRSEEGKSEDRQATAASADARRSPVGNADRARQLQRGRHVGDERGWRSHADERRDGTYWSDAEWIICHDGKARRAQPDIRLLVDGLPGRVDLWRIAGNAIVVEAAKEVIAAFLDAEAECLRLNQVSVLSADGVFA